MQIVGLIMLRRDFLARDTNYVVIPLAISTTAGTSVTQIILSKHAAAFICVAYRTNILSNSSDCSSREYVNDLCARAKLEHLL